MISWLVVVCNILENVSEQFNDNGSLLPTNPRPRYVGHKVIINLQILNRDRCNPGILINRPLYGPRYGGA